MFATAKQVSFLETLRRDRDPQCEVIEEVRFDTLTKQGASQYIDRFMAIQRQRPVAQARPAQVPAVEIPVGTFTIVKEDGSYRTLQVGPAKWADGEIVASFLSGSDNEVSYTGFAFVKADGRIVVWKKFRDNTTGLKEDLEFLIQGGANEAHERFLDHAEKFALKSGRCMRCNHKLTVPASLYRGLGPVCADMEGVR